MFAIIQSFCLGWSRNSGPSVFAIIQDSVVVGPDILDHRCLQSYRNSVVVGPEILDHQCLRSSRISVSVGPEILNHQCLQSYRNSVVVGPEILDHQCLRSYRISVSVGPEILDHQCLRSYLVQNFWSCISRNSGIIGVCDHHRAPRRFFDDVRSMFLLLLLFPI